MIEEGSVLGSPGLPMLNNETIVAAVRAAHRHNKLAIAHTLTVATTMQAIAAGMDGLAHLFLDRPHSPELVATIARSGAFVTPCLVLNSSIMGHPATEIAADERVRSKLSQVWLNTLRSCFIPICEQRRNPPNGERLVPARARLSDCSTWAGTSRCPYG